MPASGPPDCLSTARPAPPHGVLASLRLWRTGELTRRGTSRCCFRGPIEMLRCPSAPRPRHPPRHRHHLLTGRHARIAKSHTPCTHAHAHGGDCPRQWAPGARIPRTHRAQVRFKSWSADGDAVGERASAWHARTHRRSRRQRADRARSRRTRPPRAARPPSCCAAFHPFHDGTCVVDAAREVRVSVRAVSRFVTVRVSMTLIKVHGYPGTKTSEEKKPCRFTAETLLSCSLILGKPIQNVRILES